MSSLPTVPMIAAAALTLSFACSAPESTGDFALGVFADGTLGGQTQRFWLDACIKLTHAQALPLQSPYLNTMDALEAGALPVEELAPGQYSIAVMTTADTGANQPSDCKSGWALKRLNGTDPKNPDHWEAEDATLISSNPAMGFVSRGETTDVEFVFKLEDDSVVIVNPSAGPLTIVIDIIKGHNVAPIVNASASANSVLENVALTLLSSVSDDGKPNGTTQTTWSQINGPGIASIADLHQTETTAVFSEAGTYVLRLTATDGDLVSTSEVSIEVLPAPVVTNTEVFYVNGVDGNDQNAGTETAPWKTITKANQSLTAGQEVVVQGATRSGQAISYDKQPIAPIRSGTGPDDMIVYRAEPAGEVMLTGAHDRDYMIILNERSYVRVEGFKIRDAKRAIEIRNGHHNIAQNIDADFTNPNGPWPGYFSVYLYEGSHHNQILNSEFNNNPVGDTVGMNADYNLFEGNRLKEAAHSLINVRGKHNTIRNNVFENSIEKCTEIAWQTTGNAGEGEFNVLEHNIMKNCGRTWNYSGLQLSAPRNIVRFNSIYDGKGSGIFIFTGGEFDSSGNCQSNCDPHANNNRIYHNTIYNHGGRASPGIQFNRRFGGQQQNYK